MKSSKIKDVQNGKKPSSPYYCVKDKLLALCTCTALEVMTAIGVTGYLIYLEEPILALISSVVFAKLIVFHFIMDYYDKKTKKNTQSLSLKKH